jgi:hypothetical protein
MKSGEELLVCLYYRLMMIDMSEWFRAVMRRARRGEERRSRKQSGNKTNRKNNTGRRKTYDAPEDDVTAVQ